MVYYFIGGPWNHRLYESNCVLTCWRVVIPDQRPLTWLLDDPDTVKDCILETVDYYPDYPLETGVAVMSSLWGYDRSRRPWSTETETDHS